MYVYIIYKYTIQIYWNDYLYKLKIILFNHYNIEIKSSRIHKFLDVFQITNPNQTN